MLLRRLRACRQLRRGLSRRGAGAAEGMLDRLDDRAIWIIRDAEQKARDAKKKAKQIEEKPLAIEGPKE